MPPDYTPYQEGIIRRYYQNREALALQKLEDLVAELYLAETENRKNRLWKQVGTAMAHLKVPAGLAEHILKKRSPEVLAQNLKDWWAALPRNPPPTTPPSGPDA